MEAVTVTAQKREENVQKVPESISVLTSRDIEDAHLTDVSDLHTTIPNPMSYNTNSRAVSTPMFNMRGLGNLYEGDSAISFYIDDIPVTDPSFFNFPLDNIERIGLRLLPGFRIWRRFPHGLFANHGRNPR